MDHQMNMLVRDKFGEYYIRIPLRKSATIRCANALTTDWESVVPKSELSYILGNPPFVGARLMGFEQKADLMSVFGELKGSGNLDYVTCWYKKAALFIQGTNVHVAFVSTNSICQGEQVPILWPELMLKYGILINFAHTTFRWSNEARGQAAVYCVIVGFSLRDFKVKKLFIYRDVDGDPTEISASKINAYLVDAPTVFVDSRREPICKVPRMLFGNMPNDGGNLLLSAEERNALLSADPAIAPLIKMFLGADDFLNNHPRFCIWLKDISPSSYRHNSFISDRILRVKELREKSARIETRALSQFPGLFGEIRQPNTDYILVPRHSSENRKYIPIGFIDKDVITGDSNLIITDARIFEFGILTSTMHMAWMRYVCGRLELRYRYSASIVYNNFPWPAPTDKQREGIEAAAQAVLDARAKFPDCSLADLYDPTTMPPELAKAHSKLDRLVEKAYGKSFESDAERVAFLFERYQRLTADLFTDTGGKRRKAKSA